jgi:hypothetical protein
MKIKHWQGYGLVDATKVEKRTRDGKTFITIKVKGNHEWGIHRDDTYDVARWLLSKFSKEFKSGEKSYRNIEYMNLVDGYERDDRGCEIDTCLYEIQFS